MTQEQFDNLLYVISLIDTQRDLMGVGCGVDKSVSGDTPHRSIYTVPPTHLPPQTPNILLTPGILLSPDGVPLPPEALLPPGVPSP